MGVKNRKNEDLCAVFKPIMFLTNVLLIKPFISGYKDRILQGSIQDFFEKIVRIV
jgi:hypothetical protein